MIKAISFKNFKSFKNEVYFEIKPITLIYGLNGTGKSSILQILQLLKQSMDNSSEGVLMPKVNSEDSIDLGSYEEFIYQHKKSNNLEITFHGNYYENFSTPSIRRQIQSINRENTSYDVKQSKIFNIINSKQKIETREYRIKIIFNLDENSNIHQRKIIIHLDNKPLLEVDRGKNDKEFVLHTKKCLIKDEYSDLFLKYLKTKINKKITKMICSYNNKKLVLDREEALTLKWLYIHCKINKTNKWVLNYNNSHAKKILKNLSINEITLKTLIRSINNKFKSHPSIRKDYKFIKIVRDESNNLNTLLWDIDFNKTNLKFLLDPEIKEITYKDVLIADFELAIDLHKNKKQWNFDNIYKFIDPDFPFNLTFNRDILNNENHLSSINNFINDLKNKKLTKKLIKETIEYNFANEFWKEEGFLIRKDPRSGGFSSLTGKYYGFLGRDFEDVFGSYFMNKIKRHNNSFLKNRREISSENIFTDINRINIDIRDFLKDIFHLAPQAIRVPRINTFKGTNPDNVGHSGSNMPDLLFKNNSIMRECNKTLKNLNIPFEIIVEGLSRGDQKETGLYELRVLDKITKTNVQVSDTGYGISQLITFMVHLINSKYNQITMKEELEAHLHPSWQIKLPDLINLSILDSENTIDFNFGKNNKGQKWILETHSEHLILKLKKMIKEKKIKNENIAIYYAYKDKKTSSSKLDKIELDENGKFLNKWRDGFFQERLDLI